MGESVYEDLPEEPELAFLFLESIYSREVRTEESGWGSEPTPVSIYIEYIGKTLATLDELGLDGLKDWSTPLYADYSYGMYLDFKASVTNYSTKLQIRHGKRATRFSVRLDATAKLKIHHHVSQIRDFLVVVPLDAAKRERLFDKLAAFESEVDRDRTRFESFGAAIIEFAGVVGEAAEQAEPARKWLDSIAKLVWGSKNDETGRLPRPAERKRIEPPKDEYTSIEDDIPF